eukprot:CAMPEP_0168434152 /NCGR_PEP_ID=MMETSP0228-20121227/39762_1 /TAXON_ID=133427 /ORGANISM="Protoceratium reticulatum, Strain CCCM 535 (=CCMP 1889)" /LENGTH=413 /DNA_ID=CAMNT_0008448307 /DNA_START=31 /DNA_END=1273 /DNA_ORIENTATION=-
MANTEGEAAEEPVPLVPSAARAAKRARQRERRRMGRVAVNSEQSGDIEHAQATCAPSGTVEGPPSGDVAPVTAAAAVAAPGLPEFAKVQEPAQVEPHGHEHARAAREDGEEAIGPASTESAARAARGVHAPVGNLLRAQVEHLARGPSTLAGGEAEAEATVSADDPSWEDCVFPSLAAGFGQSTGARGVGRGRPISGDQQGPWHSPLGRGVGRGKALAPPPGLQGLNLQGSQKILGGLSQPWMPGPPIPEDDDESGGTPILHWADPQDRAGLSTWLPPNLELPSSAFGLSRNGGSTPSYAEHTPSYWASYALDTGGEVVEDPIPTESPGLKMSAIGDRLGTCGSLFGGAGAAGPEYGLFSPGVIPMYVTVPIAMAHMCPHCGKHFALPPGGEAGAAAPGAGDASQPPAEDPPG